MDGKLHVLKCDNKTLLFVELLCFNENIEHLVVSDTTVGPISFMGIL